MRSFDTRDARAKLRRPLFAVLLATLALLASAARPLPRLDWPIPALLRAVEYGTILLLAGASPWAYALLATLAARHYDIVYRVRTFGTDPSPWLALVAGGWPARCAVLVVAALVGPVEGAVILLTTVLAPLIMIDAAVSWVRSGR